MDELLHQPVSILVYTLKAISTSDLVDTCRREEVAVPSSVKIGRGIAPLLLLERLFGLPRFFKWIEGARPRFEQVVLSLKRWSVKIRRGIVPLLLVSIMEGRVVHCLIL